MSFDWFTLVAQLINFGLLLLLLRLFLYQPVLNVMDEREERLARSWSEAERAQEEARAAAARLAADTADLERARRQRLDQIEAEAQRHRQQRLHQAEREAAADLARQRAALEEGRERLVNRLQARSAGVLVDELHASLADLADADLERRAVAVFARRLAALGAERLAELRAAARGTQPRIATAFAADEAARADLAAAVRRALGDGSAPEFVVDERLLFGVELTVGAARVAVSGRERLAALEAAFSGALDELTALGEAGGADAPR